MVIFFWLSTAVIDLLDGSNPYGTNWHHKSPYNVGLSSERAMLSSDGSDVRSF